MIPCDVAIVPIPNSHLPSNTVPIPRVPLPAPEHSSLRVLQGRCHSGHTPKKTSPDHHWNIPYPYLYFVSLASSLLIPGWNRSSTKTKFDLFSISQHTAVCMRAL